MAADEYASWPDEPVTLVEVREGPTEGPGGWSLPICIAGSRANAMRGIIAARDDAKRCTVLRALESDNARCLETRRSTTL